LTPCNHGRRQIWCQGLRRVPDFTTSDVLIAAGLIAAGSIAAGAGNSPGPSPGAVSAQRFREMVRT
ncbi:MAG: hypothetical protein M3Y35_03700, partial [Actinomycetota bacterium]|nr:hypothetical protein [Actinomycetota bacterium]